MKESARNARRKESMNAKWKSFRNMMIKELGRMFMRITSAAVVEEKDIHQHERDAKRNCRM